MTTQPAPLVLAPTPFDVPSNVEIDPGIRVVEMQHAGVTLTELPHLFDGGFAVLSGLAPIGPGYAIYDGQMTGTFHLTIGFPVAGPPPMTLEPTNVASPPAELPVGVRASAFPSGPAMVMSHLGSFEGLGAAWRRFGEHPLVAGRRMIEIYVTDPSQTPVEELRTDLVVPLT